MLLYATIKLSLILLFKKVLVYGIEVLSFKMIKPPIIFIIPCRNLTNFVIYLISIVFLLTVRYVALVIVF
jgi:hypothetical protein